MNIPEFAYLLLTCDRTEARMFDWQEWSCIDILAAFIEVENQAISGDGLWTLDWEHCMDRISPVQVSIGWDPRPYLVEVFDNCQITPLYKADGYGEDEKDAFIYFDEIPEILLMKDIIDSASLDISQIKNIKDKKRFDQILMYSADLARQQNRGLLFIGEWGAAQPYGIDQLIGKKRVFQDSGMKIFSRFEPIPTISKKIESPKSMDHLTLKETINKNRIQCEDNLKHLSMGTMMYAMDNEERYPNSKNWYEEISIYLNTENDTLHCPSDEGAISYAMNSCLSEVNMSEVHGPQRTVLFYESSSNVINASGTGQDIAVPSRHTDGNIFLFADGHTEIINTAESHKIKWSIN